MGIASENAHRASITTARITQTRYYPEHNNGVRAAFVTRHTCGGDGLRGNQFGDESGARGASASINTDMDFRSREQLHCAPQVADPKLQFGGVAEMRSYFSWTRSETLLLFIANGEINDQI
jgi:hypothetical protein